MTIAEMPAESETRVTRVIGCVRGELPGPTLIVIGGMHGNEPAGVRAAQRVMRQLERTAIVCGEFVALAGNLTALETDQRFIDRDLNRSFTQDQLRRARAKRATGVELEVEESEQLALLDQIETVIARARGQVYFIDLHTTSSESPAFATIGDTIPNRRFAMNMPLPLILGLEEQVDGPLLEYMNQQNIVTLGIEAGQHYAEESVDRHAAVIRLALTHTGLVERDPERVRADEFEISGRGIAPRVVEVVYCERITPRDEFRMKPGFVNFQPVSKGEHLADTTDGPILAPRDGLLLLPLYQGKGNDGFFIGKRVRPMWLRVSMLLRQMRLGRVVHWLPGVRQHPSRPDAVLINTRVARLFPLQFFHLLGFRKRRQVENVLVVSRRSFDLI